MVSKDKKSFGRPFRTERRVKQGDPVSTTILKTVVDTLVREVLVEVCRHQEAHHGFSWAAGGHSIFFYADNVSMAGSKPIWFQTTLIAMVRMFDWVGILTNIGNTKAMVFTPSFIWG